MDVVGVSLNPFVLSLLAVNQYRSLPLSWKPIALTLFCEIDERTPIFEVAWSKQLMVHVSVPGELITVTETPARCTEILAVCSIEVDVKQLLEFRNVLLSSEVLVSGDYG